MRRTALLLCAPVLAAGLLAGCDLPGGSPKAFGPDTVPNDQPPGATIKAPAFINGTVDGNDQRDFYTIAPRSPQSNSLEISCTGDVSVYVDVEGGQINIEQTGFYLNCGDGTTRVPIEPGSSALIEIEANGPNLATYALTTTFSTVELLP
jgi:hypothetical protein